LVKKRSFLAFFLNQKNPIPSHTEKSFTISILKKKIPNYYWLLVILPNSTLSVFNKKQQESTKHTKNNRKTPFT